MATEPELLAGLVAHPTEDDRWLVLADWLEDHGDPRAELARLRYLLHTEPGHPDHAARLTRQRHLLDAGLRPVVPALTTAAGAACALIQAGFFWRGSDESRYRVTLTRPFYLGIYPVTVGEFAHFVQATGYRTEAETSGGAWGYVRSQWKQHPAITWRTPGFAQTDRHPVVCVTWNDAQAFVAWLNQVETTAGLGYTLPTEAQWEYACRAGSPAAYWWGDDASKLGEHAWFIDNAGKKTHPVETKRPNPWGLWHIGGHVWEWCADWYGDDPTGDVTDPLGASAGSYRANRGGAWNDGAANCRAAYRGYSDPWIRYTNRGLRLAASVRVE